MEKIRGLIKNKKGQALIELCISLPIILMVVLGTLDVAKANIIKMENTQAMQMFLSKIASDSEEENTPNKMLSDTGSYIQQASLFCTEVVGASTKSSCGSGTNPPIKTELRLEKAKSGPLVAGTQICMASKSTFKPLLSTLNGKSMTIYSRSCTLMETAKNADNTGWNAITFGLW